MVYQGLVTLGMGVVNHLSGEIVKNAGIKNDFRKIATEAAVVMTVDKTKEKMQEKADDN